MHEIGRARRSANLAFQYTKPARRHLLITSLQALEDLRSLSQAETHTLNIKPSVNCVVFFAACLCRRILNIYHTLKTPGAFCRRYSQVSEVGGNSEKTLFGEKVRNRIAVYIRLRSLTNIRSPLMDCKTTEAPFDAREFGLFWGRDWGRWRAAETSSAGG